MKTFLFMMQLLTPDGALPMQREPMPSMEACVARATEMQTRLAAINEDFTFMTGCVQASKKADPV